MVIFSQINQLIRLILMEDRIDTEVLQRFKIIKKMGSGAYGVVFKVEDRVDGKIKALKKNFDAFTNSTDAQRTYREIMFLFQLKHPNIIKLYDVIKAQNAKDIYLLFEFSQATLYQVSRARGVLSNHHRTFILYQVALALYYLHSAGIMHRDLKPANVLVNEHCHVKVIYFGLVRSIEEYESVQNEEMMTEYIATRWYRAPEIILGSRKYSKAVDIWSFGCLIAQTYTGKPLFPGNSTLNQIQRVFKWTGTPSLSDIKSLKTNFGRQLIDLVSHLKPIDKNQVIPNADSVCMDLINKTLEFNVEKRLSIEEVLMHPYFHEHFNPKDLIKSEKKVCLPVEDRNKLGLKQYRSLIYEQISKNRTKLEIRRPRQKSASISNKYKSSPNQQVDKSKIKNKSQFHKNSSTTFELTNKDLKTIKHEDRSNKKPKKNSQEPVSRLGSRERAQRKMFSRGTSFSKHETTTTVVVRPKRFFTEANYKRKYH